MKKKNLFLTSFVIIFLLQNIFIGKICAQNWLTAGNTLTGTEFLGSTSGAFPLDIKTTPAQPIDFYTGNAQRMTLTSTGELGLSNSWAFTPLSLVHLNNSGAVALHTRFTNSASANGGSR